MPVSARVEEGRPTFHWWQVLAITLCTTIVCTSAGVMTFAYVTAKPPEAVPHHAGAEKYLSAQEYIQAVAAARGINMTPTVSPSPSSSPAAAPAATPSPTPIPTDAKPIPFAGVERGTKVPYTSQFADLTEKADIEGGKQEVKVPSKFGYLNPQNPVPRYLLPVPLTSMYPGEEPKDKSVYAFHWIINTCKRQQWGRMLSTTLLSGLFNGLKPATISIVWCKKYTDGAHPSLLYNMRHSHSVNVFFPPDALVEAKLSPTDIAYITALMVPTALGMEHLPAFITEDDIFVTPDANAHLAVAAKQANERSNSEPFTLLLYHALGVGPLPNTEGEIPQAGDDRATSQQSHAIGGAELQKSSNYGSQGHFHSPGMVSLLLHHMLTLVNRTELPPNGHLSDIMVTELLNTAWRCNQRDSGCHFFMVYPSLVQHIGTSSSLFNVDGRNQRWHVGNRFTVKVGFPGFDADGTW